MNFPVQLPRSDHQFTQPIVYDHLSIGYSQPENTIMDVTCYSQVDEKRPVVMDLSTRRDYSGIPNNCPAVKTIPYQLPLRAGPATKPLAYCTPNPVPNVPENNQVHLLEYRGAQLAAFTVEGRDLVCLPQAFELFLKHLVGGLHTVYTKLKRLEIVPVVCNVEQVRILRGLGAIQPGVNRCKLIAPQEFDILYADCTSSSARPGRPSKRIANVSTPPNSGCSLSSPNLPTPLSSNGHFGSGEPLMKMLRTSLGDDVDFPNKFPPWTRNVTSYSPGSLLIPPSLFSLCNTVGRADPPYGNSSSVMTHTFGRGIPGGQEEPGVNTFNTGSHIRHLPNGGVDTLTDMEAMSKLLGTFCSADLTSLVNKCGLLSSSNLDTPRSIPSQIPQSSNRSGSRNGKWDLNKPSAMSHAIHSAFSVSEWDNAPCTLSHGLVNPSQTEARSSGLPYPPRSRLESSNSYSTLPFSALNLIERDKTGQEIIGQHLDTTALRIPASTSNQTCILSTTDDTNCETSPDSNSESSMTEHHGRLNASHSPQDAFSKSDSKRHLEVPSYFDTIFQHLLEVYNQVKSAKVSEPPVINPVSLFLYDGFSRDTQKSPTSVDNKPQCKLPSLFPGNLSMDPLRPTNLWFGSNGTNSGAHHRNSISSSSSQTTPKGPSQSETQVENDAIQTPSMKTGNDFEPNSFGQPENGLTPTPESDNTSLQTISIPKLSQGANYFYYGLQLMAKSFMSRYLQSNPNEIEKTPMTKVSTTTDE